MSAAFVEQSLPQLFDQVRSVTSDELVFVNPSQTMIAGLVQWGVGLEEEPPRVEVLAEEWTLKNAIKRFPVASRSADLIERGSLDLRYIDDPPKSAVIADEEHGIAIIEAGNHVGALVSTDASFVDDLNATYQAYLAEAESLTLHTPPISVIETTMAEHLGDDRRDDLLAFVETADQDAGAQLDEVLISLLIAAKNHDLLYDISKWGEDIGLASKATYSRKKSELEEVGLIDTDKEYIDIGRPRLRLKFTDESMRDAPIPEIVDRVTTALG